MAPDGRTKTTIIQRRDGKFTVYLYRFDDSDLKEGWTKAVGWIGVMGPSETDTLQIAERIAGEFLRSGQPKTEE